MAAVDSSETELLRRIVSSSGEYNFREPRLRDILPETEIRRMEIVRFLLEQKASVNAPNATGMTPLHAAARAGNLPLVQFLLESGADSCLRNKNDETPLMVAMEALHTPVVEFLLTQKHPSFHEFREKTPLHSAVIAGNPTFVKTFIDAGLDVNRLTQYGESPLSYAAGNNLAFPPKWTGLATDSDYKRYVACRANNLQIVRLLLQAKATPNPEQPFALWPLSVAVKHNRTDIAEELLKAGADPNRTDQWSPPALYSALCLENSKLVELLLNAGADPNVSFFENETPFSSFFTIHSEKDSEKILEMLRKAGGKILNPSQMSTALRKCDRKSSKWPELLRFLPEVIQNFQMQKSLNKHHLIRFLFYLDDEESIRLLLQAGVNFSDPYYGGEILPFHSRVSNGDFTAVETFLKLGADVNLRDYRGKTPLICSVEHPEVLKLLLNAGADVDACDDSGRTALMYAIIKKIRPPSNNSSRQRRTSNFPTSAEIPRSCMPSGMAICRS